jgi:hypothetical protein
MIAGDAAFFVCLTFSGSALLLLLLPLSLAFYIIDDTDPNIAYSGRFDHLSGNWTLPTSFPNGTIGSVTGELCYNHTL